MPRILIVEDEGKLRRALQAGLQEQGYEVSVAEDGPDGRNRALAGSYDCLVLDLMLPGCDGLEILRAVRAAGLRTPTLILTARGAVEDRVLGLESGADDYLPKPFAWAEFLARVRACLRRSPAAAAVVLRVGPLELDCVHRCLGAADRKVELTEREFELIEYLARRPGQVVSRATLAREVWQEPEGELTNIIDVYINYLRKKIKRAGGPALIHTVRGVGYCLQE